MKQFFSGKSQDMSDYLKPEEDTAPLITPFIHFGNFSGLANFIRSYDPNWIEN